MLAVRPCVRCGYELSGLPETAVCPECALPLVESVVVWTGTEAQAYLRRLRSGVGWLWAALAAPWLALVGLAMPLGMELVVVVWAALAASACAWCWGCVLLGGAGPVGSGVIDLRSCLSLRAGAAAVFWSGLAGSASMLLGTVLIESSVGVFALMFVGGLSLIVFGVCGITTWVEAFGAAGRIARMVAHAPGLARACRLTAAAPLVLVTVVFPPLFCVLGAAAAVAGVVVLVMVRSAVGRMVLEGGARAGGGGSAAGAPGSQG